MAKTRKWTQKAVPASHKGRFTAWCKAHGFSGPSVSCIVAAKKTGDKEVIGMATFAERAKKGF